MKHTIGATHEALKNIFSNKYFFQIPLYQRPYAWTTEQASELLDDLCTAMGTCETHVKDVPPYFLGSIVLIKDSEDMRSQVVDGQQRLTTLTILISTLRELSEIEKETQDLDMHIREKSHRYSETEDRFRLELRERERDFFRNNVQERGQLEKFLNQNTTQFSDIEKRIFENTDYFKCKLSEMDQSKRTRLADFLLMHSYLVVVSASDENSACRIFTVMNDRGLDLLPTDILKAEIINEVPEEIRSEYTVTWEEIEDELGRENFKDLFAHIRMIYMKSKQIETLHQDFRDNVLSKINGKKFIDNVLIPLNESYTIVSTSTYESANYGKLINKYLNHLRGVDNEDWIPPAIAFFDNYRDDDEDIFNFVRDLDRLAYALSILRANRHEHLKRYVSLLNAIEKKEDLYADSSPLQLTSEDKKNTLENLDGSIYSPTKVPKPLLLRINSILDEDGPTYGNKQVTIEHVLPQNPKPESQWVEWFPDEDERIKWTDRLGNLVLLSRRKNAQAGNFEFDRKKEEYFQKGRTTTFALTVRVLNETKWTPKVLERRQKELLDELKKEWRLN